MSGRALQAFFREPRCNNKIGFTIARIGRADDTESLMRRHINSDAIRFNE